MPARRWRATLNPTDKLVYEAIKIGIVLIPVSLGAFMLIAACVGYGKPPVRWYVRAIVGCVGLVLIFLSIRGGMVPK